MFPGNGQRRSARYLSRDSCDPGPADISIYEYMYIISIIILYTINVHMLCQ